MNIPSTAVATEDWERAVTELIAAARSMQALHRPVLLLYLLGRSQRKEPPEVSFVDVENAIQPILEQFGRAKKAEVLLPFWHLQTAPFWEILNADDLPRRKGKDRPTRSTLVRMNATGRVKPSWWAWLTQSELPGKLGERVLQELLPTEDDRSKVANLIHFERRWSG